MLLIRIEKTYINNGTIHYHYQNDNCYISESKASNRQKISRLLKFLVSLGVLMLTIFL